MSPLRLPPRFILLDTEYTAWEGAQARSFSGPGEFREIIQIGAIIVRADTLAEESSLSSYVRPVMNPQLSGYIIELTGIAQETLDQEGAPLEEGLARLQAFAGTLPIYSYGNDGSVLKENCELIGTPFPFSDWNQFRNLRVPLKPVLEDLGIEFGRYSSGTLIEAFGKRAAWRAHDALNDMRNLLEALRELRSLGRLL